MPQVSQGIGCALPTAPLTALCHSAFRQSRGAEVPLCQGPLLHHGLPTQTTEAPKNNHKRGAVPIRTSSLRRSSSYCGSACGSNKKRKNELALKVTKIAKISRKPTGSREILELLGGFEPPTSSLPTHKHLIFLVVGYCVLSFLKACAAILSEICSCSLLSLVVP